MKTFIRKQDQLLLTSWSLYIWWSIINRQVLNVFTARFVRRDWNDFVLRFCFSYKYMTRSRHRFEIDYMSTMSRSLQGKASCHLFRQAFEIIQERYLRIRFWKIEILYLLFKTRHKWNSETVSNGQKNIVPVKKAVTVCLEPLNIISTGPKQTMNLCKGAHLMRLCLKLAFQLPVQRGHRRWNILYEDTMSILVRPHLTPPHLQRHHLPGMTNNGWGHVKWFPIQLPLEVAIDCSHKVGCILTRSLNLVSKRLFFLIRCSQVEQVTWYLFCVWPVVLN